MKMVVCVKQVPDTWAEKRLTGADHTVDRESVDSVINELDEYAVEEALRLKEVSGGEVTVLTMGPAGAADVLRKALSMGADAAVHVVDDALAGSDAVVTSAVLAAAVRTVEPDLVLFGVESTDARMGVLPAMVAERLAATQLTQARKVEPVDGGLRIERQTDYGYDVVEGPLPAVVSVVEKINEPRYPSFKGIMAAKKKPLTTLSVAELGLAADAVGLAASASAVADHAEAPPRGAGVIVDDEGRGGVKIAEFLADRKFV